jgi:hypothetical protein
VLYKIQQVNDPLYTSIHSSLSTDVQKPWRATSSLLHIPAHITAKSTTEPDSPDQSSPTSNGSDSDTLRLSKLGHPLPVMFMHRIIL